MVHRLTNAAARLFAVAALLRARSVARPPAGSCIPLAL
jgi:hypothetical protein